MAEASAADTPGPEAAEPFVTIARIRRSQGRRGEVAAELLTDFPQRFAGAEPVWLVGSDGRHRPARLEGFWLHKGAVILKFAGVDDLGAAKKLAGYEVCIPAAQRRPLEGSAVYWSDLPGCRVVEGGRELGVVRWLDPIPGTPVLVVDTPEGELLVPFAEEICRRIDLAGRVIEVELPDGLLELNQLPRKALDVDDF